MIGMFNIVCTNIEPLLCEFNGFFQFRGALNGATPYGAYRAADFYPGIVSHWYVFFTHLPVFRQGKPGIGFVMGFAG